MFGVFRLRFGRDNPTAPPLLRLPLPIRHRRSRCVRGTPKERFICLRRAPSISRSPPSDLSFRFDSLPCFPPGSPEYHRPRRRGSAGRPAGSPRRSDYFGSCYVLRSLFTTIAKRLIAFRGYDLLGGFGINVANNLDFDMPDMLLLN